MPTYLVTRMPPSFPHRNVRTEGSTRSITIALYLAETCSLRNDDGNYTVYAVEGSKLVRGAIFAAGRLVAIGQEGSDPSRWDWSAEE